MATIPSNLNFPTSKQVPDHAIMDFYNKQVYLGNQFISGPDSVSLADTDEHNLLTIQNPAANKVSLFISKFLFGADGASDDILFRIYSQPTGISSGSPNTPQNCRIASGSAATALVLVAPTTSTKGTRMLSQAAGLSSRNIDASMIIIDPGFSILITGQAAAAAVASCQLVHYEI